jgi:hypothetical protein
LFLESNFPAIHGFARHSNFSRFIPNFAVPADAMSEEQAERTSIIGGSR